jgi:hypothetical protein
VNLKQKLVQRRILDTIDEANKSGDLLAQEIRFLDINEVSAGSKISLHCIFAMKEQSLEVIQKATK